ncbi:MAG TPA: hypothetical protein VJC11_01370 [Patescibacteria group bacterium]|nr:hypothetical protein [Patescibacteria group bacterium]
MEIIYYTVTSFVVTLFTVFSLLSIFGSNEDYKFLRAILVSGVIATSGVLGTFFGPWGVLISVLINLAAIMKVLSFGALAAILFDVGVSLAYYFIVYIFAPFAGRGF